MIGLLVLAQLAIVAHAPETVAACDAVEVTVAVSAPGSTAPQLVPPPFAPFDVLRSSVTPHVQLDPRNGGSIIAEYRYVLTTDQSGSFTIPPFEVRLRGATARSRPIRVVVRGSRASDRLPTVVARARIDTSLDVNFRALTEPETVYVGQQANYEVAVFLNETVRDRLRRNPTFYPPDMQSMLAYDLPPVAGEPPKRKVGTRCFDALVPARALSARARSIRDRARAARVLAASFVELFQSRRVSRVGDGQYDSRRRRPTECWPAGRVRRRRRRPCDRVAARYSPRARRRSDAPHR